MALQSCFNCLHRRLPERNAFLVDLLAQRDDGGYALPRHRFGPRYHRLDIDQLGPVPMSFQDAPAPFDGMILAMVWWGIEQLNRLANGIAKGHHALQKLRALSTAF